jgi:hypothetical protein
MTMNRRWMVGCALFLGGLLVVSVGCWQSGPSRVKPPAIDASAAGAEAIKMYDTNKDDKISGDELDKCPALKAAIAQIDPGGQGDITAEKITARIRKWQESKVGKTSCSCKVLRNGQPFAGATVTLVPEKFLGPNVQPATGTTDANGVAMISVALNANPSPTGQRETPGVAPGLYRVVITKQGTDIPVKYSAEAESTLGMEVALDSKDVRGGPTFDLKF